jgi:hypothetical protein
MLNTNSRCTEHSNTSERTLINISASSAPAGSTLHTGEFGSQEMKDEISVIPKQRMYSLTFEVYFLQPLMINFTSLDTCPT